MDDFCGWILLWWDIINFLDLGFRGFFNGLVGVMIDVVLFKIFGIGLVYFLLFGLML